MTCRYLVVLKLLVWYTKLDCFYDLVKVKRLNRGDNYGKVFFIE